MRSEDRNCSLLERQDEALSEVVDLTAMPVRHQSAQN